METRRIVVPSRKRVANIPRVLSMLPNATICVAESEEAAYRDVVPTKQLLLHPEMHGLAAIRNWLAKTLQEDCLVEIDDDLRGISRRSARQSGSPTPRYRRCDQGPSPSLPDGPGMLVMCCERTIRLGTFSARKATP